jgi:hypothetical protein
MEKLLHGLKSLKSENVIILMDSNSSSQYPLASSTEAEPSNGDAVANVLEREEFINLIEDGMGCECLKMRHGSGGQQKKFGEFMFDTIDKIAIRGNMKGEFSPISLQVPFRTYSEQASSGYYEMNPVDLFNTIRTNDTKRKVVKNLVTVEEWGDKVGFTQGRVLIPDNVVLPQDYQRFLYPNTKAPSDHPPCSATITFMP